MQCLQDPNLRNVDKLNSVRREGSGHCRNKKKEYLKVKIDEFKLTLRPRISETYTVASMTLRRATSLVLIYESIRKVNWLQTPREFWLGGETISPSCSVYMGLVMLMADRNKCSRTTSA